MARLLREKGADGRDEKQMMRARETASAARKKTKHNNSKAGEIDE